MIFFLLIFPFFLFAEPSFFANDDKILYFYLDDVQNISHIVKQIPEGTLVGIDPSQIIVDQILAKKISNCVFQKGNFRDYPKRETFQWIYSSSLRLLSQDLISVIGELAPSATKGSKILLELPRHIPFALESAIRYVLMGEKWQKILPQNQIKTVFFDREHLEKEVGPLQLQLTTFRSAPKDQCFSSKETFSNYLEKWIPHVISIPFEVRDEFFNEVCNRYVEIFPPDKQGKIHFLYETCSLHVEVK